MSPEYLPNEDWWKSIKAALNLSPPLLRILRACKKSAKDSHFDHRHTNWGRVVCDLEKILFVVIRELMAFIGQRCREQLNYNSSIGTKPVHQKHNLSSDLGLIFRKASNTSKVLWTWGSFYITKAPASLQGKAGLQFHENKGLVGWNGTISAFSLWGMQRGLGQSSKQKTK